jgi:hypothetical protein
MFIPLFIHLIIAVAVANGYFKWFNSKFILLPLSVIYTFLIFKIFLLQAHIGLMLYSPYTTIQYLLLPPSLYTMSLLYEVALVIYLS